MQGRRKCCRNTSILLFGTLLVAFGITTLMCFDTFYDMLITNSLLFYPSTEAYKAWLKNDPPLIMDIYIFNWTNPDELNNNDIKPKFQEVGPFRFKEIKEKINVTLNDNNTVTYRHMKHYFFCEENSPMQLSETITTINAVALVSNLKTMQADPLLYANKNVRSIR